MSIPVITGEMLGLMGHVSTYSVLTGIPNVRDRYAKKQIDKQANKQNLWNISNINYTEDEDEVPTDGKR